MEWRHRARDGFFSLWFVALAFNWLAPDDGVIWIVVRALLAVAWAGCGVAWLAGWAMARRRGDQTAQVDATVVLAFGALAAGGVALLTQEVSGSAGGATLTLVVGLTLAVGGYLFVAAHAPPPARSSKPDDDG